MFSDTTANASEMPRVGRYVPRLRIGGGELSHVFVADQVVAAGTRRVVLKCLRSAGVANPILRERFEEAARRAIRLCHPNLVQALDADVASATPFVASEWLQGVTLADFFEDVGRTRLQLTELLWILTQVLAGICYLHELKGFDGSAAGLAHTEVVPSNIFLTSSGAVKLLGAGFRGFSQDTREVGAGPSSRVGGKTEVLAYAAPEQCLGLAVDERADVYAVGVLLWEAMAGRARAIGETQLSQVEARFLGSEPNILELWPTAPKQLAAICTQALEPNREDRFASARVFKQALERYLASTGDSVGPAPLAALLAREFDRRFSALEDELAVVSSVPRSGIREAAGTHDFDIRPGAPHRPPISLLAVEAPSGLTGAPSFRVPATQPPPRAARARRWVWAVPLMGGLLVSGAWLLRSSPIVRATRAAFLAPGVPSAAAPASELPQQPKSQAEPSPKMADAVALGERIDLQITSDPQGTLFIDSKLVGATPFRGSVLADGKEHVVLVTAPNRVPAERVISYRSSIQTHLKLAKRRPKPNASTATP